MSEESKKVDGVSSKKVLEDAMLDDENVRLSRVESRRTLRKKRKKKKTGTDVPRSQTTG